MKKTKSAKKTSTNNTAKKSTAKKKTEDKKQFENNCPVDGFATDVHDSDGVKVEFATVN